MDWGIEDQESEQEEDTGEKIEVEVTIANEYRNVRALQGSIGYINKATESGHKPHLYHLAETWWEADNHPILE
jgi:AMMECR1 domain-containing protein